MTFWSTYTRNFVVFLALNVSLFKELVCNQVGHLPLYFPRLGDGRHVASSHHHAAQQLPVTILPPIVRPGFNQIKEGFSFPANTRAVWLLIELMCFLILINSGLKWAQIISSELQIDAGVFSLLSTHYIKTQPEKEYNFSTWSTSTT